MLFRSAQTNGYQPSTENHLLSLWIQEVIWKQYSYYYVALKEDIKIKMIQTWSRVFC